MAIRALIVILIVGLAGFYARTLGGAPVAPPGIPTLDRLPSQIEGWVAEDYELDATSAEVLDADATILRRYRNADGVSVWLFLAYFREQQVGSQIHSPQHCLPGSGWSIVRSEEVVLPLDSGPQRAQRVEMERNAARQQLFYWFRTRHGSVTGEYHLKLDLMRNSLLRRPTDAVFVRYHGRQDRPEALIDFMGLLGPRLDEILGEVGL